MTDHRDRTLIVTGAGGFIGGAVIQAAAHAGWNVIGLTSNPEPRPAQPELHAVRAVRPWPSSDTADCVREIVLSSTGLVSLVHTAGDASFGDGEHYASVNTKFTMEVASALLASGAVNRRFVFCSSIGAQDVPINASTIGQGWSEESPAEPRSDYGRSKLAAEDLLRQWAPQVAVARLGMVVGEGMRDGSHVRAMGQRLARAPGITKRILMMCEGVLPLVDVADAASGLLHLADPSTPAGVYLVTDENLPIREVASLLQPGPATRVTLPKVPIRVAARLPLEAATILSPVMTFDSSRLRSTGWAPSHDIRATIREIGEQERARANPIRRGAHAVVTGAASGLGLALAQRLHTMGVHVTAVDLPGASTDRLNVFLPHEASIACDVRNTEELIASVRLRERALGVPVSAAFLAAGIGRCAALTEQSDDEALAQLEVNFVARMRLSRYFAQQFTRSGGGAMLLVSSSTAIQPLPRFSIYGASNAAVSALGRSLAQELRGTGVDVLSILPGGMDTGFQETAGVRRPDGDKLMDPSVVAARAIEALQRHRSGELIIGRNARAMSVAARVLPTSLADRLWARISAGMR